MSWLTRQKTTRELFRWNVTAEVAMQLLCEAYMREVVLRGSNSDMGENTLSYLQAVADMMTAKSTKCGILLCGNCGNGKTTTMNAFITMCKYMDLLEESGKSETTELTSLPRFLLPSLCIMLHLNILPQ